MPANLQTPKQTTITISSTSTAYFEMDTDNYRINVKVYDRDENGDMVQGSLRETGWTDMFQDAERTQPNLNPEDWALFAQATTMVKELVYAFGKRANIVDADAVVE